MGSLQMKVEYKYYVHRDNDEESIAYFDCYSKAKDYYDAHAGGFGQQISLWEERKETTVKRLIR